MEKIPDFRIREEDVRNYILREDEKLNLQNPNSIILLSISPEGLGKVYSQSR